MGNNKYKDLTKSKEINTMKTPVFMIIIIALFLASCSSTYQAGTPYDEVYATSDRKVTKVTKEKVTVTSGTVEQKDVYGEGDYYSQGYDQDDFDAEGYYDYEYSSRIKRFNSEATGFDYYDNYYTDSYQYTGITHNHGTSIYSGCGTCYSYPSVALSLGFGWGYPYYRHGWYDPFYYRSPWSFPYYGYYPYYGHYPYYGYNSYWTGYNHGYWDGYYGSGYGGGYYYPSYDDDRSGKSYYGPRGTRSGASDGSGLARGTGRAGSDQGGSGDMKSASSREARSVTYDPSTRSNDKTSEATATRNRGTATNNTATGTESRVRNESGTATREGTAVRGDVRQTRSAEEATRTSERPAAQASRSNTGNSQRDVSSVRRYDFPEQKYEKPRTYTSPKVRTTPSRNEYSSPSSRTTRGLSTDDNTRKYNIRETQRRPVETRPSDNRSTRPGSIIPPTQRRETNRSYTAPARNSNNRSYSSPSRSGGGESRSFSAPARSSSSSGSVRSSGSSSGSSSRSSGTSTNSSSRGGGRR